MASASYSEDLTCPICLTIFTDPVNLPCGHSFCRGCITDALSSQQQCPQCRTAVPTEIKSLPTSHILKSLAEKAKEAEKIKTEPAKEKAGVSELCPEHEEKLKLFCVTDQQLACIICRDGERHEGHKFKPIKEAAAFLRQELEKGMENLCGDIPAMESLANTQRQEIRKTKAKSEQLMTQIHRQFEEMHQFLRKREDEIKNELKFKEQDDVEKMSKSLKVIETALSERIEVEAKVTSVLKIEDSERLLKSWTEGNSRVTAEDLIKPKANDLQVVDSSLSLGPYESHLQFFMWKEMLQVIQPRAELLSLKSNSADIAVSEDGRSLFCTPKSNQASLGSFSTFGSATSQARAFAFADFYGTPKTPDYPSFSGLGQTTSPAFGSTTGFGQTMTPPSFDNNCVIHTNPEFTSGQHYWEVEVGHRDYWELGIKDHFLKYDGQQYSICSPNIVTELGCEDRPRKIGVYLNCALEKLSFYDADNMKHIHTMSSSLMSTPLSAYFNIRVTSPDLNPLTVCCVRRQLLSVFRTMASASYSEDLTCPICLTIFTDPVTLLCGHSFCRGCITVALSSQELCPQCRTAVPTEIKSLPTSHILKSLAEKAKEAEKIKTEPAKEKAEVSELCPKHEEKLKLFCVTDQQLACIICRDGERHEGHKFKPINEAAASLRQELEGGIENLFDDILAIESLANTQRGEIRNTKAKSEQLMTQINRQFEEMHQFLRKREDEIKNELKHKEEDDVEKMSKSLYIIETALFESRELVGKVTSVLKIEDSERLLKSWTEGNSRVTAEDLIKPKANDLQVVDSSLSLGPYESHLQFFMWKEMLQVIEPPAELLSLKSNSADIAVSEDGRSLFSTLKSNSADIAVSEDGQSLFCSPRSNQAPSGQTTIPVFGPAKGSGQTSTPLFGPAKGSGQTTNHLFGSAKKSGQTTIPLFGSTKGSGQTSTPLFGPAKGSGQTSTPLFGSAKGSGQTTNHLFGSAKESGQTTNHLFGSPKGSGQTSTPLFGSAKESGQTSTHLFGFPKGSGQTTNHLFGFPKGSGQTTSHLFGSAKGSGQTTNHLFGFPKGSGQTTSHLFGSAKGSGQTTNHLFGSPKGSGQTTNHLFGSAKGSGQTTNHVFGSPK
ncbi:uncharacterized protein LOC126402121 [Epinephelus moara]|uniref:uncharacterized protein LOC126402121 n=1 Tax=Epinephelus moara TaxID=300413 RepID=UPI00214E1CCA|nr:uncharacterized protein LOC126402121 [Epinephelus moara]